MEHRLITGGEHLLPFARSCITKLKKLGLPYASQSFEVDGVSVKVRIEPGHEYIRIEGGLLRFDMDSGVVALAEGNIYGAGILHWSGAANAYNAAFQTPENGRLTHQGPGSYSSRVRLPANLKKTKGSLLPDKSPAASFSPGDISDGLEPPGVIPNPADDALKDKRMAANGGVASIYTGKCRLYVQSILGTPLYDRDDKGKITGSSTYIRGGKIDPYVPKGENPDPYPLDISVSTPCGVYLDPDTGKHWFFSPQDTYVMVYPLVSSPAGERSRHHLIAAKSKLNAADREHLEAYILARSRPDPERVQTAQTGQLPSGITMGYLWHWAWSTPVADMVVNAGFTRYVGDAHHLAMFSIHYRLTMVLSPPSKVMEGGVEVSKPGVWSAKLSVVEGRKEWQVNREMWPILEPMSGVMHKITPPRIYGDALFNCDAPFYVFYLRDEIQVCRIRVEVVEGELTRETTDGFSDETPGTSHGFPGYSLGMGDGESFDKLIPAHWVASISCGAWVSEPGYMNWEDTRTGLKISGKVPAPLPPELPHGTLSSDYLDPETSPGSNLMTGAPSGPPTSPVWAQTRTWQPYEAVGGNSGFTKTQYVRSTYRNTTLVAAVPYGDAEAIFIRSVARTVNQVRDTVSRYTGGFIPSWQGSWRLWTVGSTYDPNEGRVVGYIHFTTWAQHTSAFGNDIASTDEVVDETNYRTSCRLFGRANGADTLLPDVNFNVGIEDFVNTKVFTMSGTSVANPIVHVPDLVIAGVLNTDVTNIGMPPDIPFPVIVGWV